MITKRKYKNLSWIDLKSPTSEEIRKLIDEFSVHPRIAEELLSPTIRPKCNIYDDVVYLILHFPTIRHTHSNEQNQEVDFVISKKSLVTVHYDTVDSIQTFAREFEVRAMVDKNKRTKRTHAGFLFCDLIRQLYKSVQDELDLIESRLTTIENKVFLDKERQMVKELSKVSRNLLDMEQAIEGHERVLNNLLAEGQRIFGKAFFLRELQDIMHEYHTVYLRIRDQREFLAELRTTNDSLLSAKQNEVMKTLTILAFITFPLSLVATIFGMNTKVLPLVGIPGDFWFVIGIMVALTILMFFYFKHKKWF